ncbi:hypothetical protein HDU79_006287 [Rhizoclosmatium sp. JEL0117]|nr:hypothetical protein HDU79_006287 [Rhizoclosmatium sp. JEL0117]
MLFVAQPPTTPNNRYVSGGAPSPSPSNTNNSNIVPTVTTTQPTGSFRRSYIVCQEPSQQLQQTEAGYKQAYDKAQSRISSLEKTVEFLQEQHKCTLKDLHKEIARLQNLCSETSTEKTEMKAPWVKEPRRPFINDSNTNPIVHDINEDTLHDDEIDETKPYYVLLQQQRKKYQTFIERMNADNKRKQSEIDSLRAELELVRDVLSVSGLDVDLIQLRNMVNGKEKAKELASRAKKINVLPPIQKTDSDVNVQALLDEAVPANVVMDSRLQQRLIAAASPPLPAGSPRGSLARMDRLKQKPKDYHNGNLDYQGRAHLYTVPPSEQSGPQDTEGFAPSAEQELEMIKDTNSSVGKPETVLPPISSAGARGKSLMEKVEPFLPKADKNGSSWTKRLKGTQMLRQKNWSSINK